MANKIVEKSFIFAQKSISVYLKLKSMGHFRLADQFIGSSTSIGANIEEAQAAHSKVDFISKMVIASKEARECRYWIKLLDRDDLLSIDEDFKFLKSEVEELILILNSIVKTSRASVEKKS